LEDGLLVNLARKHPVTAWSGLTMTSTRILPIPRVSGKIKSLLTRKIVDVPLVFS
jgi:hypothetical protein